MQSEDARADGRTTTAAEPGPARADDTATGPINGLLEESAIRRPAGWAVRDPGTALSYPELLAAVRREAAALRTAGLDEGDLVTVEAVHGVDYLVSYFALLRLGARLLPLDPAATAAEAERERARYGVRFALRSGTSPVADRLTRLPGTSDGGARGGVAGGSAVLLPTSGTGGLPKRALHREERLVANARAHADSVGLTQDDVCLVVLSPAFGYCHTAQILATVALSGRLVFPPRPALPAELGAVIGEHGVTTTTMVPHQVGAQMLRALGRGGSLRQLVLGGSAVTEEAAARIAEALPGTELLQTWGMTEAGPRLTTWRSGRDGHRPGSVGLPLAGVQVVAAGPDGSVALPGFPPDRAAHPGELVVRTPYLMAGYLDDPEQTWSASPGPDLLCTGDLGRVDEAGYVYIEGRIKNLIDVGGKKVTPEEIEAALLELEGVAQARVFAETDRMRGQVPVAEVVAEPGVFLDPERLAESLRQRLARHKWPRSIDVVEQITRTVNGKVRRW